MTKPIRILVLEKYVETFRKLIQVPHELTSFNKETDESYSNKLRDVDVMISSFVKGEWLQKDAPLKLVQGVGAGTEGIDFAGLPSSCAVCNVYGHEWAVAEYSFMTMAMLKREVIKQDAALRAGNWSGGVFRNELRGCNLLVLGLGHIGAEVARWGEFYGMQVTGLTRSPSAERGQHLGLNQIDSLTKMHDYLPQADFVVVAIPNTAETAGFVGQAELKMMKDSAYLVNVARGPVVDEQSLYEGLRDKVIAGAANDVWYIYPNALDEVCIPATYPFHELPNIIMTPHNAGTTNGTMNYRFEFIADNIGRYYRGEPLENVVHAQSK
ncbi:MAG: phosphoglycerate dehydrogenase-like enzyme [Cellvibrionaceae bacterium]|jgi:phosphoglycerate dehydrogenase-like enzyme